MSDASNVFIKPWQEVSYANEAEKQRKQERLKNAIERNSILRELAKNAALLRAAEIVNQHHEPSMYRAELYRELSQTLIGEWVLRLEGLPSTVYLEGRKTILGQVAYHIIYDNKGDSISRANLEFYILDYIHNYKPSKIKEGQSITGAMIESLVDGDLILCLQGNNHYRFVHRAFLEYFCACEFVKRFNKRGVQAGLTLDELKNEIFGKHWQDESWHEILSLIVEMLHPEFGKQIIHYLKNQEAGEQEATKTSLISKCLEAVNRR